MARPGEGMPVFFPKLLDFWVPLEPGLRSLSRVSRHLFPAAIFPASVASGLLLPPVNPLSWIPETWKQAVIRWRWRLGGRGLRLAAHTRVDRSTRLERSVELKTGAAIFGSQVGRRSYFGEHTLVIHADIGSYCSIAPHVIVGGGVQMQVTQYVAPEGRQVDRGEEQIGPARMKGGTLLRAGGAGAVMNAPETGATASSSTSGK